MVVVAKVVHTAGDALIGDQVTRDRIKFWCVKMPLFQKYTLASVPVPLCAFIKVNITSSLRDHTKAYYCHL